MSAPPRRARGSARRGSGAGSDGAPGPGVELEGTARDVAFGGDGVVLTERGIFLVPGVLPGERVRIAVEPGRRPPRARLLSLLERSPDRVEPPCPLVDRCGGCPLMRLEVSAQLRLKAGWVARALAGAGAPSIETIAATGSLAYRRRARLRWQASPRLLGFAAARSHRVVDVERCAVLDPALSRALDAARVRLLPRLTGSGELSLALGAAGRAVARITTDTPQASALYGAARALVADGELAGVVLAVGGSAPGAVGDPRERSTGIDGETLLGPSAGGFAQAHREINEALVRTVAELAGAAGARVLELYAGHGNLTVALAGAAERLLAIEADAEAAAAARENLAARGLGPDRARVLTADVRVAVEQQLRRGEHDVLVVDPPRTGLDAALLERLAALRISRLVYVSCNPPALERDVATLARLGLRADRAVVLEMFPQTSHVEAVVRLVRPSPR